MRGPILQGGGKFPPFLFAPPSLHFPPGKGILESESNKEVHLWQRPTNVMRLLDQAKIPYTHREYDISDGLIDGISVANKLGQDPARCFKTLVARGHSGGFYVFLLPVAAELNLKKAAKAAGEKSVELLHVKELLPVTGYVRGGCSPIGMKKPFPTLVDESCLEGEEMMISGGKKGVQITLSPKDLLNFVGASTASLTGKGDAR